MHIAVCVKQIPDPAEPTQFDPETFRLDRTSAKIVLDESDAAGVEMALQLVEATGGDGTVTLISMAPDGEEAGIRTGLAMGADQATVVSDPALAGSDALATSKVLGALVGSVSPDIVLTGTESSDGYAGTVPEQIAAVRGLPSVTFAKSIAYEDGSVTVERQTASGFDRISCPTPCVISLTAGVVEPRYPSFKGIRAAKSKPVTHFGLGDIGLNEAELGTRQSVRSITDAENTKTGRTITDDGTAHDEILAFLEQANAL